MSNFRVPAKAVRSALLRRHPYSTTKNENNEQGNEDKEEDKIKSEKFRALLPYLKQRNSQSLPLAPVEKQTIFTKADDGQKQPVSELTNIFDTTPEIPKDNSSHSINTLEEAPPPQDNSNVGKPQQNPSTENYNREEVISPLNILGSVPKPQSLPVLMVSKAKSPVADLSSALVPLSLHLRDKNILVDAVVQDVKQAYNEALVKLDKLYLEARAQGRELYIVAEQYIKQPAPLQNVLKEKALQLYNEKSKNALALQEPKLFTLMSIDVTSIVEKTKSTIENLISNIRNALKQKEGSRDEKTESKKEGKKEAKPEGST